MVDPVRRLSVLTSRKVLGSLLILLCLLSLTGGTSCSGRWVYLRGTGGCFLFSTEKVNWDTARQRCVAEGSGSDLARITLSEHREDVANYITSNLDKGMIWWIGGNKRTGTWSWNDGQAINKEEWHSNQPDDDIDNNTCLDLWKPERYGAALFDKDCNVEYRFICKK